MKRAGVAVVASLALLASAPRAAAQGGAPAGEKPPSGESVAMARKLFAEALKDEDEKRFSVALDKFRRVQDVKSTPAVRYRIASCLEGMGKLREALADFRALAAERFASRADQDIATSASAEADKILQRIPHVTVELSAHAPADAEVRLDDEPLAAAALREPIAVDPGDHEVTARAQNAPPFVSRFNVAEGGRLSLQIPLDPASTSSSSPPPPPPPPPPPEHPTEKPSRVPGYVLLGAGGVLAAAAIVVLVLRHNDIGELNQACGADGACPASRASELTSVRSRALAEGPIAGVLAGAAVVAGGLGAYFTLRPVAPPPSAPTAGRVVGIAIGAGGAF